MDHGSRYPNLCSAYLVNMPFFLIIFAQTFKMFVFLQGHGLPSLGVAMAGGAVAVVNLKILLEARYWSWTLVMFVLTSIGFFVVNTLVFDIILITSKTNLLVYESNYNEYYTYNEVFKYPIINLAVVMLILVLALLPDLLLIIYENTREKLKSAKNVMPMPSI